jgi:hypothetical protein
MIPVEELIYEFKLTLNKVNRQDNIDIPIEDIIVYLNKAQVSWIKTKINPNNVYKVGYDSIRKRIDDLQILKVSNVPLKPNKTNDLFHVGFDCPLKDAANYMFYISSYAVAKSGKCSQPIEIDLVRHGELTTKYLDNNYSPSFEWRTTLATLGNDNLTVYTDSKFQIEKVFVTYLRYPLDIDVEGYVKFDGTSSLNQDSELPEYAKSDIVDLAVKFAAQSTDNQAQAVFADDRLNKNSE